MLPSINIEPFYVDINKTTLYQGDVIKAEGVELKDHDDPCSPDYWMIITKSCDLVFLPTGLPRKQNISLVPLFTLKLVKALFKRDLSHFMSRWRNRIVLIAIQKLSNVCLAKHVDSMIKDKITKFMFLPYEGTLFEEPMVIDFDMVVQLDGSDLNEVTKTLSAKKLQLASPFREKVAQRFAHHYSSIGIDDGEIKNPKYVKTIEKYVKNL